MSTEPHRIDVHHHLLPPDYLSSNPNAIRSLQELVDASHIHFGSNCPFAPEAATFFDIQGIENFDGFDELARKAIEWESALALFPRFQ